MSGLSEYLNAVRERAEAATQGPWTASPGDSYDAYPHIMHEPGHSFIVYDHSEEDAAKAMDDFKMPGIDANATFIAHARADVPRLLDIVEVLAKSLERLTNAAEAHIADQGGARDERVGLTQPITVAEGVELCEAYKESVASLAAAEAIADITRTANPHTPERRERQMHELKTARETAAEAERDGLRCKVAQYRADFETANAAADRIDRERRNALSESAALKQQLVEMTDAFHQVGEQRRIFADELHAVRKKLATAEAIAKGEK